MYSGHAQVMCKAISLRVLIRLSTITMGPPRSGRLLATVRLYSKYVSVQKFLIKNSCRSSSLPSSTPY